MLCELLQPQIDEVSDKIRQISQKMTRMQQQGEQIRSGITRQRTEITGKNYDKIHL